MRLICQGKVKDVYELSDRELLFKFSDRISVFDQIIPSMIPRKGESLARASAFWFEKVRDMGIKTHFIELPKPDEMRVKRVSVIKDYSKINTKTVNYQIPLEIVMRWYCAGSFYQALKSGKKKPRDYGLDHMPEYGERLPEPYFEQTTKLEHVDRKLDTAEALKISGLTSNELGQIKDICIRIDEMMQKEVGKRGLIHVDGKKEFAMDGKRNIMLIDTFGTADEDRWWDATEYKKGKIVEISKEFVRKWYENDVVYTCPACGKCKFSYKQFLDQLREDNAPQVGVPPLSSEMVKKTAGLYSSLFERITGQRL
jgi:phosphoribosylaminoimidazole-succinocarboxamide synthase